MENFSGPPQACVTSLCTAAHPQRCKALAMMRTRHSWSRGRTSGISGTGPLSLTLIHVHSVRECSSTDHVADVAVCLGTTPNSHDLAQASARHARPSKELKTLESPGTSRADGCSPAAGSSSPSRQHHEQQLSFALSLILAAGRARSRRAQFHPGPICHSPALQAVHPNRKRASTCSALVGALPVLV